MTGSKNDLIKYRLAQAWETLDDAKILADNEKWNSYEYAGTANENRV